jgi:hypothetical protein
LEANQAVSFFIKVDEFRDQASVQSQTLENSKTQEKLVFEGKIRGHYNYVTISRYQMGINDEEWIEETGKHANREIEFDGGD